MAKFRRKPKEVEAIRLVRGVGEASSGEWLVIEGENQFFMSDEMFSEEFEPWHLENGGLPKPSDPNYQNKRTPDHHADRLRNPEERSALPGDYDPRQGLMKYPGA